MNDHPVNELLLLAPVCNLFGSNHNTQHINGESLGLNLHKILTDKSDEEFAAKSLPSQSDHRPSISIRHAATSSMIHHLTLNTCNSVQKKCKHQAGRQGRHLSHHGVCRPGEASLGAAATPRDDSALPLLGIVLDLGRNSIHLIHSTKYILKIIQKIFLK